MALLAARTCLRLCIWRRARLEALSELPQETQVVLEEQAQVLHAVAQHRQPFEATAKGKADVTLRIEAHVADHRGGNLAGTRYLEPLAGVLARFEQHVDLSRRFGERKVRRTEAYKD